MLFAAPTAFADSAVCEQYPDIPQCAAPATGGGGDTTADPGGGGGSEATGGSAAIPDGSGAAGASADAGPGKTADLPFTGYPLSPLVAILLVALAAGIGIRAYLALRGKYVLSTGDR